MSSLSFSLSLPTFRVPPSSSALFPNPSPSSCRFQESHDVLPPPSSTYPNETPPTTTLNDRNETSSTPSWTSIHLELLDGFRLEDLGPWDGVRVEGSIAVLVYKRWRYGRRKRVSERGENESRSSSWTKEKGSEKVGTYKLVRVRIQWRELRAMFDLYVCAEGEEVSRGRWER